MNNELCHYGILGMHWGVRKKEYERPEPYYGDNDPEYNNRSNNRKRSKGGGSNEGISKDAVGLAVGTAVLGAVIGVAVYKHYKKPLSAAKNSVNMPKNIEALRNNPNLRKPLSGVGPKKPQSPSGGGTMNVKRGRKLAKKVTQTVSNTSTSPSGRGAIGVRAMRWGVRRGQRSDGALKQLPLPAPQQLALPAPTVRNAVKTKSAAKTVINNSPALLLPAPTVSVKSKTPKINLELGGKPTTARTILNNKQVSGYTNQINKFKNVHAKAVDDYTMDTLAKTADLLKNHKY